MIKTILKKFYRSHRLGSSVGKTLLWIWLRRDLPKIKGDFGVDLAGGSMNNKRFFATKKYLSVDIDKKKLDLGKSQNFDALIEICDIETFLQTNNERPDVMLCVQTMGTNEYFEHDKTEKVIKLMYDHLKPNGSMLFNIGSYKIRDFIFFKKNLLSYFDGKFESVEAKFYGALHVTKKKSMNPLIRLFLAYIMDLFPPFRTFFGLRKRKLYFCCLKKK